MRGGEPDDYARIYHALRGAGIEFVLVGGQACDLWAELTEDREPELKAFRPYTSQDIDVCSLSAEDVKAAAKALDVEPTLGDAGSPDVVMGGMHVPLGAKETVLVQFLTGIFGVNPPRRVMDGAQPVRWEAQGLELLLAHPLQLLEGKLKMVGKRASKLQQDFKHLGMLALVCRDFISQAVRDGEEREAIKLCKKILALARTREATQAAKLGVRIEGAVPTSVFNPGSAPTFEAFLERAVPGWLREIEEGRRGRRRA